MINLNEYGIKSKAVYYLDYGDFENLVVKELPKITECKDIEDYSFVAAEECGNDSTHEFGENDPDFEDGDFDYLIQKLKEGNYRGVNHDIVNFLIYKEVIPRGEYIIDVCW